MWFTALALAIVLDGLRGEISIAELCRREGIERTIRDCKFLRQPFATESSSWVLF
jgi:hypothetical protein